MGACADLLHDIREQRSAAQKVADDLGAQEKALKNHIIDKLPKGDTGAAGKFYKVQVTTREIPQVKDWNAFYTYITKKKRFDMLQRRTSDTAITEMWGKGQAVPGVEPFNIVSVSLTKLK
jgi:hypothetical protein